MRAHGRFLAVVTTLLNVVRFAKTLSAKCQTLEDQVETAMNVGEDGSRYVYLAEYALVWELTNKSVTLDNRNVRDARG